MQDFAPHLPLITAGLAALTLLVVVAVLLAVRRLPTAAPLTPDALILALRAENETLRRDADEQARVSRGELADSLHKFQTAIGHSFGVLGEHIDGKVREFGGRLGDGINAMSNGVETIRQKLDRDIAAMGEDATRGRDTLRETIESRLESHGQTHTVHAKTLREEVGDSLRTLGDRNAATLTEMSLNQRERLERTEQALRELTAKHEAAQASLRESVEGRLDALRGENAAKLEEMRRTVDEKLQSTLEARLGESFTRVVEHLNRVHEGLGEMKNLAANVGDLKGVLTNVKVRGTYGEVQLALILEQFLSPHQFVKDARVNERSLERVEFAVRFPGRGEGAEVLLPIDAKFPRETFERLIDASERGDAPAAQQLRRELDLQIRKCAKDIRDKYVLPPTTTDFAVMFLPTESLYAEVLRQPGLFELLQRDYKVTVAGPTTLAALLSALQIGFRTLSIEKRSSEVWQILGAVKTEFGKYNGVVEGLAKQLDTAMKSVDKLGTRTRAISRTLRGVHDLPDGGSAAALFFPDGDEERADASVIKLGAAGAAPLLLPDNAA